MTDVQIGKTYLETLKVIELLKPEEKERIPKELIEEFENNKDAEYLFNIDSEKTLKSQISSETKSLLAYLFKDYIATKEDREEIIELEKQKIIEEENEKSKIKVEPIFEKKNISYNNPNTTAITVVKKKNIFGRLFESIKHLITRK